MKTRLLLTPIIFFALVIGFTACEDSSVDAGIEFKVETKTVEDLPANADAERGAPVDFTFYNLTEGTVVSDEDSASTSWDIAFSATTVLVNNGTSGAGDGGAVVLDLDFEEVTTAPSEGYQVDTDTSEAVSGWYNYTGREGNPPHAVIPLENKTIVLKTADGEQYAKLRIISYYEGNPDTSTEEFANLETRPADRYYTFEYAIQLNGSREFVEEE